MHPNQQQNYFTRNTEGWNDPLRVWNKSPEEGDGQVMFP